MRPCGPHCGTEFKPDVVARISPATGDAVTAFPRHLRDRHFLGRNGFAVLSAVAAPASLTVALTPDAFVPAILAVFMASVPVTIIMLREGCTILGQCGHQSNKGQSKYPRPNEGASGPRTSQLRLHACSLASKISTPS